MIVGMILARENYEVPGEKPVPLPLCLPQIPYIVAWDRTRSSAVKGRRLNT